MILPDRPSEEQSQAAADAVTLKEDGISAIESSVNHLVFGNREINAWGR